jgi:hypothetical protein
MTEEVEKNEEKKTIHISKQIKSIYLYNGNF